MIRILFIAYYFPPAGGAGVQRSLKFVQYLPATGILPTVLTGPTSPDHRWTPHDLTLIDSIPQEVRVHRVEGAVPHDASRLRGRLNRWLGMPNSFAKWWTRSSTQLAVRVMDGEAAIFATMAPFESAEVARTLSQRFGIPWVADLRDPWALDEMQVYPTLLHRRLEMARMESVLSTASLVIMNTPEAAAALKTAFPMLRDRHVMSIPNGFDQADFDKAVEPRRDAKFRIVHSGYLHTANGLELRNRAVYRLFGGAQEGVDILTRSHTVLLDAVERWCSRDAQIASDLEIVLAGKTSEEDRAVVNKSTVRSVVRLAGYLPHAQSLELVRTADLLFLPMHDLPVGTRSRIVPGKTYEYMAAGRPILAAVPDGDARIFLSKCGTASLCRPADTEGMIEILNRVYVAWKRKEPQNQGNLEFVRQFERQHQTHTLADALYSVVQESPRYSVSALVDQQAQMQPRLH